MAMRRALLLYLCSRYSHYGSTYYGFTLIGARGELLAMAMLWLCVEHCGYTYHGFTY